MFMPGFDRKYHDGALKPYAHCEDSKNATFS